MWFRNITHHILKESHPRVGSASQKFHKAVYSVQDGIVADKGSGPLGTITNSDQPAQHREWKQGMWYIAADKLVTPNCFP